MGASGCQTGQQPCQQHESPFVGPAQRSEEHTSELQSHHDLVCRLLLEKKKSGIIMVQEGRGLFANMSVRENLILGDYTLGNAGEETERRIGGAFVLFPRMK